jgi:Tol biopolymer transport system component
VSSAGTTSATVTESSIASTASTTGPPLPGLMLYTVAGGQYGDDTAFVSRLDGSQARQLTPEGESCCVRVSPDGRTILGAHQTADMRITTAIFPMGKGAMRALPLPSGTLNLGPGAWTPDGKRIVVQGWDDSNESVAGMYVVDSADGGHRVRLTHEPPHTNDTPGDVSPDGKLLVFLREDAPTSDATNVGALLVMNMDGTGTVRQLEPSSFGAGYGSMRFSPDGSKILFQDGRTSPRGALWTIRPDGTGLTKVFDDPVLFASHPTWSPDGTMILFALNPVADYFRHPPNALYVINADGSGLRKILDDGEFKREAEWFLPR